MKQKHKN